MSNMVHPKECNKYNPDKKLKEIKFNENIENITIITKLIKLQDGQPKKINNIPKGILKKENNKSQSKAVSINPVIEYNFIDNSLSEFGDFSSLHKINIIKLPNFNMIANGNKLWNYTKNIFTFNVVLKNKINNTTDKS